MGLISKEVEVRLKAKNIKHFESLGYDLPKHKTKTGKMSSDDELLIVKVEDLFKGCNSVKVEVECDCCGKQYFIVYSQYIKYNYDGKVYCKKCGKQLFCGKEKSPRWNHDLTQEERELKRNYPEYTDFVKKVMIRDNYTCQCCGRNDNNMRVHHLDSYNWCKEKRTDVSNGITLCNNCHNNFHLLYGKGNNTKEQFEEWLGTTYININDYKGELPETKKLYCIEDKTIYDNAKDYAIKYNAVLGNVYYACNHNGNHISQGNHVFWYDDYIKMSEEEINQIILKQKTAFKTPKEVVCVTTNKEFKTAKEAGEFYDCDNSSIIKVCRGKLKHCGKLEDGTKLQWRYKY